jgi:hypothetical protein
VQQFVFNNDPRAGQKSVVYMQYWMMNRAPCPTNTDPNLNGPNWGTSGTNCYINSVKAAVLPSSLDISSLASVVMDTSATSSGDEAMLIVGTTVYDVYVPESALGLYQGWRTAEFNVFGNSNSEKAVFTDPTAAVTVQLAVHRADDLFVAPTCSGPGTYVTGETNSLTLVPSSCCAWMIPYGGSGIQFLETASGGGVPAFCILNTMPMH